jgi:hypothetical protein
MTNSQILERVIQRVPYPSQIKDMDLTTQQTAIRLTWRGQRFDVNDRLSVEEIEGGMRLGSNIAILLEALLKL